MERAIFRYRGVEVDVEIHEGYDGMFRAVPFYGKDDEVIEEAPTRRALGLAMIRRGYEWVRDIK